MTRINLDFDENSTPSALRVSARFLNEMAAVMENGTMDWDDPGADPDENPADQAPECPHDHTPNAETVAALEESAAGAADTAPKRKRRTKAEIAADEAAKASGGGVADPAPSTALAQGAAIDPTTPVLKGAILIRDSSGNPKVRYDDPAIAAQALIEVINAAPTVASLNNILGVNGDAISAIGVELSNKVVEAYGNRSEYLKAPLAEPLAETPAAAPAPTGPTQYYVTKPDGTKVSYTHQQHVAEVLMTFADEMKSADEVKAFGNNNGETIMSLEETHGVMIMTHFRSLISAFEAKQLAPVASAPVTTSPGVSVGKEVEKMLTAYFKQVGFMEGQKFLNEKCGVDRFSKIDPAQHAELYALLPTLLKA